MIHESFLLTPSSHLRCATHLVAGASSGYYDGVAREASLNRPKHESKRT